MAHFDSWDLAPATIPPRSRLHSIVPIGIGTPFVESLTGYMIRLAASHAVRVSDLIEHELRTAGLYYQVPAGILNAINGVGKSAQNWVSAIERFTLRDNLRLLTLLPFASVLDTASLMRRERAWCSRCYESSAAQGQEVYERLVWCLQCVEICPLHKVSLQTSCPVCHRELRPVCAVSRPGFCSRCRDWLGSRRGSEENRPATDYQIWVAQEFGNLLAIASSGKPVEKEGIRKVLTYYVDSFSDGNRIVAAELAGCRRSSFHNWCNGATTGRIGPLLRMCYELRIPLTSLVTGATDGLEDTAGAKAAVEARHHRGIAPSRTADRIRAALLLAAKERPAPSIREVAQRLGYSTPARLYAADSRLCKAIVRNFNKSGRNHWWRRRGAKVPDDSVIQKALQESLALEMPRPVHRTAHSLGYQTEDPLTRRFPDLCRAIKAKRVLVRAARRNALAAALKAALREEPPPSLEQIANRLGYTSHTVIRGWESHLCAKLTAKRRDFAAQSRKELGRRLQAILTEDPPPALSEVHARLGTTPSITYGNFPEIHCAIAARYRELQRQNKP
jgi:AraC-like DNA-binding protein